MTAVREAVRGRARAVRRVVGSVPVVGPAVGPVVGTAWRIAVEAARLGLRQRVTGLAAEAAFFALLSLPPLVLGLTGLAALVGSRLGADTTAELERVLSTQLGPFLTAEVVDETIVPTVTAALEGPRFDLISIGFLLSLWSGSRALAVLLETVSIMYGSHGGRGPVRLRALSVGLYVLGLGAGAVALPLLLLGPSLIAELLPQGTEGLLAAYWPVVLLLTSLLLALLYHVATPMKLAWRRTLPGALLALALWVLASWGLRALLAVTLGSGQGVVIYGPLTAPIVLILWFYLLALAVLLGAGVNAALEQVRPQRDDEGLTADERAAEGT